LLLALLAVVLHAAFSWVAFFEVLSKLVHDTARPQHFQTIFSLITISVHHRDVIDELASNAVTSKTDFAWLKHLRYNWDMHVGRSSLFYFP
jgi:hypothetical protein